MGLDNCIGGLRGGGRDPADAEFLKGAADLSGRGPALELLGQCERGAGIAVKPGVVAAIHLDQESGLGHVVPAAAMARGAAGARAADALRAEQPLHGGTGEPQALALPEQVGEVVIAPRVTDSLSC